MADDPNETGGGGGGGSADSGGSGSGSSNELARMQALATKAAKARRYHNVRIKPSVTFEIDTRYTNLKEIGSGSYGLVCSADDEIAGCKVAIKKVANVFDDLVDAKRILREIRLLRHLTGHANITAIRDVMTSPVGTRNFKDLYIVTDLFECDLDRIITSDQDLTDSHHQYFLYQILRGLKYIHSANILHRDLKPSNLLVKSNCDLAICDFGALAVHARTRVSPPVLPQRERGGWLTSPVVLLCVDVCQVLRVVSPMERC